jgi:hypothetical protein
MASKQVAVASGQALLALKIYRMCTHVMIKAKIPHGSSAHFCRIGTEKAIVLPVPVRDPPIQSRPFRISGMQAFWIPVGLLISIEASEPTSQGATSIVAKSTFSLGAGGAGSSTDTVGWMASRRFFPSVTRDGRAAGLSARSSSDLASGSIDSFLLFLDPI